MSDNTAQNEKIKVTDTYNGNIWFVILLPAFGLFTERFADSVYTGILLWALVIIMMPIGCLIDCMKLKKLGLDTSKFFRWFWFAPAYLIMREKYLGKDYLKVAVLIFFSLSALALNGFVQSQSVNNNSILDIVQNSYVQNLDNCNGNCTNVIGTQISNFLDGKPDWKSTKDGKKYNVICKGKSGSDSYEIHFVVKHDGFTYQGFAVTEIVKNGKKLTDKDFRETMTKIFIPQNINS